jgi:hypothetical protein
MNLLARLRRSAPARFAGLVALLLQLGFSSLHDPVALGPASSLLGVPICHVGGSGGAVPPTAPGTKSPLCPLCLCLQAAGAALIPPTMIALAPLTAARSDRTEPSQESTRSVRDPGIPAQPRAPPQPV